MADTRTSASRRAASHPSATRLPSSRERRPALAALAVLLIVGGAFASGFLALQAGNRADYLRVKSDVPQGAEIAESDLESVSLPEDMDGVISVDDEEAVVGLRAVAPLLAGTILTPDMLDDGSAIPPGKEVVPFGVEATNIDPDIEEGAALHVYVSPDEEGGSTDSYDGTLVSADFPEDGSGIGGDTSSSEVQVRVLMDSFDAQAIQPAILDERVSISEVAPPPSGNGGE
jgi:SAF domain